MRHLLVSLILVAACATAPDEQRHTIYVGFDHVPTASDVAELEALGASFQHRMDLARAVTLRSALEASAFRLPGVVATHDLGGDADPVVSVFMRTGATPTEEDAQDVRDAGARSAHIIGPPQDLIAAAIRLSRVPKLDELEQFISLEVDFATTIIQTGL
jgi:hypothetical protein